ncbi:MAG TPA: hypothetical protein VIR79_04815 [Nitrospira sp.]
MSTRNLSWLTPLWLVGIVALFVLSAIPVRAQHEAGTQAEQHRTSAAGHDHHNANGSPDVWEGSADGIAYSERNHHLAGWLVLLMGLAELSHAIRLPSLQWARALLPTAMLATGLFLMVWSDHQAWPIGPLSLAETFFGDDPEIAEHKVYGLLALAVGSVELFRRLGYIGHAAWATPFPLMAIVGGLMLFGHSHGVHPAAHKITMHHTVMGVMAITAGSSKLWSGWFASQPQGQLSKWEFLWAGLIMLIGAQLLIYSE